MDPLSLTVAALVAKAVQEFATQAGTHVAHGAWGALNRLVATVRGRFAQDDTGHAALERIEEDPTDETRVRELAAVVDQHISADASFRDTVAGLVQEASGDVLTGEFVTKVSGDARVDKVVNIRDVTGNVSF